jgi:hypothetical protein
MIIATVDTAPAALIAFGHSDVMILLPTPLRVALTPATAAVGTGAYRGWWWFYSPHNEEA